MATSRNRKAVPEAMAALEQFKYEVASEIGVPLKKGYNGENPPYDACKGGLWTIRK